MNSTWYRFALHTVKLPGLFYLKCTWSTRLKYLNYGPVKCIPRSKCSTTAVHWQCQCSEALHFTARPMKCICCKYIRKTLVITLLWRFLHSWPWHIKLVKTPPPPRLPKFLGYQPRVVARQKSGVASSRNDFFFRPILCGFCSLKIHHSTHFFIIFMAYRYPFHTKKLMHTYTFPHNL